MNRGLIFLLFAGIFLINSIPASAQMMGFGGMGPKPNPALTGKKIVNRLTLYKAGRYDDKNKARMLTHEKIKREIIEALRIDIMSSYTRECPVQSSIDTQDYATLISPLVRDEEGSSDWDEDVLEYQYAVAISTADFAKILCVIYNDPSMVQSIKKNQKLADDSLTQIHNLQNNTYDINKQGEYDRAFNIFRATNHFKQGVISRVTKNYEEAIGAFSSAINIYPEFSEAYFQLAMINRTLSKNQEALKNYDLAIRHNPDEANYFIERGISYYETGNLDMAINDFNHAISLKTSNTVLFSAFAARGNIYERTGEDQKALQDYIRAVELNPKVADIHFRKGLLNRRLKNYEESVKDFHHVIGLNKNNSDAYYERGTTYAFLGDKEKVLDDYKTAARLGCEKAREFLNSKNIKWD